MMPVKENKLVVGSSPWAESLPEWLLDEIKNERLILGLISVVTSDVPKVGDAEIIAYLMTSCLVAPLPSTEAKIYFYLTTKILRKRKRAVPIEICVEEISEYEQRQLEKLRTMIYDKRGGEIQHPLLNMMRIFKKEINKNNRSKWPKKSNQLSLFPNEANR